MTKNTIRLLTIAVIIFVSSVFGEAVAAERAANYKAALERAKQTGADIAVFQRGSDWNHLGEYLYAKVWSQPEFLQAVGDNVILVVVDNPEVPGSPPTSETAPADAQPSYGKRASSVPTRLLDLADENKPRPKSEIFRITCANGTRFNKRADGCFVAAGPNPNQEVLTLILKPKQEGNVLRLDFPLDDRLPGRGPGRADAGNFVVSEIEIVGMKPMVAWANAAEGAMTAAKAIDGVVDKPNDGWNALAHHHRQRTLLVVLDKPAPVGKQLLVRLICKSQWGQHVPGCISASLFASPTLKDDIKAVDRANREIADNAPFNWRDVCTPRIAYLDKAGRPVACEDRPRQNLTPASTARLLEKMQKIRMRRDELWAKAEKETGAKRAEEYLDGLLAMGNEIAFHGAYKPIQDEIRAADPENEAGCFRRLQFPPDYRNVPPFVAEAYKLVDQKKYQEALAKINAELKNTQANQRLSHEHIQRIMLGKFNIYRRWPGHEEQRFDVQREIYKFDPDTFWGLGAIGYLSMFNKTPEPVGFSYGWAPCHVKPGANVWNFTYGIVPKTFDHAGKYCLRIIHKEGKDTLKVVRVSLLEGDRVISSDEIAKTLAPGEKIEANLEVPRWPPREKLSVRLEAEAAPSKTDVGGRFEVDPLL